MQRLERKYARDVSESDVLQQEILTAHSRAVAEANEVSQLRRLVRGEVASVAVRLGQENSEFVNRIAALDHSRGPPGHQGPRGLAGGAGRATLHPWGLRGEQGEEGHRGPRGFTGIMGHSGMPGIPGMNNHVQGEEGATGTPGEMGRQGYRGYYGHVGTFSEPSGLWQECMRSYCGDLDREGSDGLACLAGSCPGKRLKSTDYFEQLQGEMAGTMLPAHQGSITCVDFGEGAGKKQVCGITAKVPSDLSFDLESLRQHKAAPFNSLEVQARLQRTGGGGGVCRQARPARLDVLLDGVSIAQASLEAGEGGDGGAFAKAWAPVKGGRKRELAPQHLDLGHRLTLSICPNPYLCFPLCSLWQWRRAPRLHCSHGF